jgi:hypothetical protein
LVKKNQSNSPYPGLGLLWILTARPVDGYKPIVYM